MVRSPAAALAFAALVGCGASLPHIEPTPPGQTDLVVERNFEAPFGLRRARLAVDGAIVYQRVFEDDAPASILALRAALAPGEHYLQTELDVVVDCGIAGALRAAYTIRSVRLFEVARSDGSGGSLTLDLHTRGLMRDFGQRLELGYRTSGSLQERPIESLPGRYRYPERCPNLAPVERAFCRAEAHVVDARSERDVVRLLCTTEKIRDMRGVQGDDAKIIELGKEADECVGQLAAHVENAVEARATCPDLPTQ